MGITDAWESLKYGQRLELEEFQQMLAERGLNLRDIPLPDLLNSPRLSTENPYQSPRTRSVPDSEVYRYFRVGKGDKVEYFAQHMAARKGKHGDKEGIHLPGPVFHAPITLPKKKGRK